MVQAEPEVWQEAHTLCQLPGLDERQHHRRRSSLCSRQGRVGVVHVWAASHWGAWDAAHGAALCGFRAALQRQLWVAHGSCMFGCINSSPQAAAAAHAMSCVCMHTLVHPAQHCCCVWHVCCVRLVQSLHRFYQVVVCVHLHATCNLCVTVGNISSTSCG